MSDLLYRFIAIEKEQTMLDSFGSQSFSFEFTVHELPELFGSFRRRESGSLSEPSRGGGQSRNRGCGANSSHSVVAGGAGHLARGRGPGCPGHHARHRPATDAFCQDTVV